MKAVWNGVVLAESDDTILLEGNYYFPMASIVRAYFIDSESSSVCPWKGTAKYLSVRTSSSLNEDAAWYYPSPKPAAKEVAGRVAFWKGVEVIP